jgi:hypothetical protein
MSTNPNSPMSSRILRSSPGTRTEPACTTRLPTTGGWTSVRTPVGAGGWTCSPTGRVRPRAPPGIQCRSQQYRQLLASSMQSSGCEETNMSSRSYGNNLTESVDRQCQRTTLLAGRITRTVGLRMSFRWIDSVCCMRPVADYWHRRYWALRWQRRLEAARTARRCRRATVQCQKRSVRNAETDRARPTTPARANGRTNGCSGRLRHLK